MVRFCHQLPMENKNKAEKDQTMAIIGYARVSTGEQHLELQVDALLEAGCERVFRDHGASAIAKKRLVFEEALNALSLGDTLMIWKMDRAFRSMRHALDTLEYLESRKVEFVALTEHIDTTTSIGKCMYHVRNAFSAMERDLLSERTKAGMEAARKRGIKLGRPKILSSQQVAEAKLRLAIPQQDTIKSIADEYGVHNRTLARALRVMN